MNRRVFLICLGQLAMVAIILSSCSSASKQGDPTDPMRSLLPGKSELTGMVPEDTAKLYERNTVWDYFSSKAEVFLNNGLNKLAAGTYKSTDGSASLAIEIIQFREPINAFTMYSRERKPWAEFPAIPAEAYLLGDTLQLIKGAYTAKLVRSGDISNELMATAARTISGKISDSAIFFPAIFAAFPAEDQIPHSEVVRIRDQGTYDEFPEFYGRQYVIDGDTLGLHVRFHSLLGLSVATAEFISAEGKIDEWLMDGVRQSLVGHDPKHGSLYCVYSDSTVVVVTGVKDRKKAELLSERLLKHLGS